MTTATARPRPLVGPLMAALGIIHVGLTPVLFPESVHSVVEAGLVNSIEVDPELAPLRGLGFWFATTGLSVVISGWAVGVLERRPEGAPRSLPLVLAGIGAWGVVLIPKSPFWVFLGLAGLAAARQAGERRTGLTKPEQGHLADDAAQSA